MVQHVTKSPGAILSSAGFVQTRRVEGRTPGIKYVIAGLLKTSRGQGLT